MTCVLGPCRSGEGSGSTAELEGSVAAGGFICSSPSDTSDASLSAGSAAGVCCPVPDGAPGVLPTVSVTIAALPASPVWSVSIGRAACWSVSASSRLSDMSLRSPLPTRSTSDRTASSPDLPPQAANATLNHTEIPDTPSLRADMPNKAPDVGRRSHFLATIDRTSAFLRDRSRPRELRFDGNVPLRWTR